MILTDTSILVALWRGPTPRLLQIVRDHDAAVCGISVAEIYAGARGPGEFIRCAALLSVFRRIALPEDLWLAAGQNISTLRSRDLTVPFPDAVLATLAITSEVELWSYDAHFAAMRAVLPALRLFVEPS